MATEDESRDSLLARHAAALADYQDAAYATRYRANLDRIARADDRIAGRSGLTEAAARSLFKLMAYKDEYEVARLYADPAFFEKLRGQFEGDLALQFHLAPPLFARRDPATGHLRKRAYGPWMLPAMRVLARMKRLRGTSLDVFGRTDERRAERRDIVDFEKVLAHLAADVDAGNYALAVEIATQPLALRGFGHVKARNRVPYAAKLATLLARFRREETIAQAAD